MIMKTLLVQVLKILATFLVISILVVLCDARDDRRELWMDTYNVALRKPVTVAPSDGTCGSSPTRSTIRRSLDSPGLRPQFEETGGRPQQQELPDLPEIYPQDPDYPGEFPGTIPYMTLKCAPGCAHKFPPNPAPQPYYQVVENRVLGDPAVQPPTLLFASSELLRANRSYSFWIKPDPENNYANLSVIVHEKGDFVLLYNKVDNTVIIRNEGNTDPPPFPTYLSPYWNHIAIQYQRAEWQESRDIQFYVNNSLVQPMRIGRGLSELLGLDQEQLAVGATYPDPGCEILKHPQCVTVHPSTAVQSGSQDGKTLPDFTKCFNSSKDVELAMKFACASMFPSCAQAQTQGACASFCELVQSKLLSSLDCDLELEKFTNLLMCERYEESACVEADVTQEYGIFRGTIRDLKVFDQVLTTRELYNLAHNTDVVDVYPNPSCMCDSKYPIFNYTKPDPLYIAFDNQQRYCSSFTSQTERNRLGFAEDIFFFSKDFVNDGMVREADQLGYFWVSTPEVETTTITIDFQTTVTVQMITMTMLSPMPMKGLIIYRRVDGVWKPWQYYAKDCASYNLPNDGIPSTFDSVVCKSYEQLNQNIRREYRKKRQASPLPSSGAQMDLPFRTQDLRPGYDEEMGFVDDRFEQFTLTDAVKVEFQGLPDNAAWGREDITEYKYHAVSEIRVMGADHAELNKQECPIQCFPGTTILQLEPKPTEPGYRKKRSVAGECPCECRKPFNREKAGEQCVPYLDSIIPTYGPEAGGTNIILRGGLLSNNGDLGMPPGVSLQGGDSLPWETCNVTFWNDTMVICHTLVQSRPMAVNKSYQVKVDHPSSEMYPLYAPEKFTFKPNPGIKAVNPLDSIVQGGVLLTVEGDNFDSVAYPWMRVQVKYNKTDPNIQYPIWTKKQLCTVQNATVMVCPTPPMWKYLPQEYIDKLNDDKTTWTTEENKRKKRSTPGAESSLLQLLYDHISDLTGPSEMRDQRTKRDVVKDGLKINDDDLEFTLGFILDGVPDFRDLEKDLPEFAQMDVLVNPVMTEFSPLVQSIPSKWPNKEVEPQIIAGQNLNKGARMADYVVTVGHEECLVTDLLGDFLTFVPPVDEPDDEGLHSQDGGKIVKLKVGNIEKRIGYLKYQGWWATGAFIGIMVAVVIVVLIILAVVGCCCYKRYTDPHYLDMKRRASGNPYVGDFASVPTKERHILERIDPELRMQIGKALLEDPDNLILEEEVGKGNFGKVYSGRTLNPVSREKTHVAVKTVKGDSNVTSVEEFLKEAIVMKNFKDPNVLPLLGVVIKENIPYVILPFMDNGDLKTFVSNENNRFTVRELVSFGLDVAQGMAYLEEQRFVHRDLAARNCMVDKDRRILIADFGLARDIYVADYYRIEDKSRPLPIRWMAIESIELQKFTTKSDVWSFGIVLWELLSRGMKPYPGIDNLDIKRFLKRGDRLEKPSHSPPEVYEVMRKCWSAKPDQRPTFRELVGMLENLLGGRKPEAPPRPKQTLPAASPEDTPNTHNTPEGYMDMNATTPPQATYLELVDMPSAEYMSV